MKFTPLPEEFVGAAVALGGELSADGNKITFAPPGLVTGNGGALTEVNTGLDYRGMVYFAVPGAPGPVVFFLGGRVSLDVWVRHDEKPMICLEITEAGGTKTAWVEISPSAENGGTRVLIARHPPTSRICWVTSKFLVSATDGSLVPQRVIEWASEEKEKALCRSAISILVPFLEGQSPEAFPFAHLPALREMLTNVKLGLRC